MECFIPARVLVPADSGFSGASMTKWSKVAAACTLAALYGGAGAQAVDPLQLRSWASACATCHGTAGVAQNGMATLAGANPDEMLRKLLDFKSGKKPSTLMYQLSRGYSDEQLQALTGYFSNLKK
jgi:cytochrome c553